VAGRPTKRIGGGAAASVGVAAGVPAGWAGAPLEAVEPVEPGAVPISGGSGAGLGASCADAAAASASEDFREAIDCFHIGRLNFSCDAIGLLGFGSEVAFRKKVCLAHRELRPATRQLYRNVLTEVRREGLGGLNEPIHMDNQGLLRNGDTGHCGRPALLNGPLKDKPRLLGECFGT